MNFLRLRRVRMYALFFPKHCYMKKLLGFAIFWGEKSSQVKFANYLTVGRSGFTKSRFSEQQSRCAEAWEIIRFGANSHGTKKSIGVTCEQDIITAILSGFDGNRIFHEAAKWTCQRAYQLRFFII